MNQITSFEQFAGLFKKRPCNRVYDYAMTHGYAAAAGQRDWWVWGLLYLKVFDPDTCPVSQALLEADRLSVSVRLFPCPGIRADGINLDYANLECANLANAHLHNASMRYANLKDAILTGAEMYGATLTEVDLDGANLERADLRYADLRGTFLTKAHLGGANLTGALFLHQHPDDLRARGATID
jgi:hypothetical protein